MKLVFRALLATSILIVSVSGSAKIKVKSEALRDHYIREASVWERPSWVTKKFKFKSKLDIIKGPKLPGRLNEYNKDEVYCITDEEYMVSELNGKTPKFFCQLLDTDQKNTFHRVFKKSGKKQKIKVKYGVDNPEVFSEVVGTRLLWSLGFYADKVYLVDKVYCLGCPEDPFNNRYVDTSTAIKPRLFTPTAIEQKISGEEVIYIGKNKKIKESGWSIKELVENKTHFESAKRKNQQIQRDALRLLAAMMGHSDSKPDNHRLVCDSASKEGYCNGAIKMLIHDIGSSFGHTSLGSVITTQKVNKLDLKRWKKRKVWSDAKKCIPKVGLLRKHTSYYKKPITEEGRKFLSQLLKGFSSGEEGRQRVLNLFRAAKIDLFEGTAELWAEVFLSKVGHILYPLGEENPDFKCPQAVN